MNDCATLDVFTGLLSKIQTFWGVTLYRLANVCGRFEESCFHLPVWPLLPVYW